jgi:hypothetical protein
MCTLPSGSSIGCNASLYTEGTVVNDDQEKEAKNLL